MGKNNQVYIIHYILILLFSPDLFIFLIQKQMIKKLQYTYIFLRILLTYLLSYISPPNFLKAQNSYFSRSSMWMKLLIWYFYPFSSIISVIMYVWHIYTTYHILLIAIKFKGTDFLIWLIAFPTTWFWFLI